MPLRDRLGWLVLAACVVLTSARARAQSEDEPRVLFERGVAQADRGEIDAAIAAFEAAYALRPHPAVLFNLGQAYSAAGKPLEAVKALRGFLAQAQPGAAHVEEAEELVRFNEARIGHLVLEVEPLDAALFLDGRALGLAREVSAIELAAGPHVLRAEAAGHQPAEHELSIQPWVAREQRLTLRLEPSPATPVLSVTRIESPQEPPRATLPPLDASSIDLVPRRRRIAAYVAGSVGVASGAAAMALRFVSEKHRVAWQTTDWDDPDQMVDEALTIQRLDDASLCAAAAGGVLMTTAITLWLVARREHTTPTGLRALSMAK